MKMDDYLDHDCFKNYILFECPQNCGKEYQKLNDGI